MPFDTLAMAAVADELRAAALGGQIQRIIQPSAPTVSLAVYAGRTLHWIVLSADAQYGRAHLAGERLAKGFATPSPFIMLLRKYLEGSRLTDVQQQPYERVLRLAGGTPASPVELVVEIMGKHSNIILLDTDGTVLGALKLVPPRQSRVRPILPGRRYTPPPSRERYPDLFGPGARIDPAEQPAAFLQALKGTPSAAPLSRTLLGLLPGAGPFLVREIAARAGCEPDAPRASASLERVCTAASELYALYASRDWHPTVFAGERGRTDFAPYEPVHCADVVPAGSISAAIEAGIGQYESRDALAAARTSVLTLVERALGAARGRVAALLSGLSATEEAEAVMENGRLILAYQHLVPLRADRLDIPELGMSIPLNPRLAPAENAEKAFRRYRKLRDARSRLPALAQAAEAEVGRLEDLAAFVRLAGSEAELRELERSLTPPVSGAQPKAGKKERRSGPLRFWLDGHTLLVGRNARENEEVTFRLAHRNDLWLHARGRTGAHAVLHSPDGDPAEAVVHAAAAVAAHYSEGRGDTAVDVDAARVRDVRKVPGGPPGRVTYRGERTVRVAPGIGEWSSRPPAAETGRP